MKNFKIFLISLLGILLLSSCGWWKSAVIPPEECFETDGEIITKYDLENEKCPTDIIIPEKIKGVVITEIWIWAFTNPNFENIIKNEAKAEFDIFEDKECNVYYKFSDIWLYKECMRLVDDLHKKVWWRKVTTLVLSDNIIKIQNEAFASNDIKSIKFWKSLSIIGSEAFLWNKISYLNFENLEQAIEINWDSFFFNPIKEVKIPKNSLYWFFEDVKINEFEKDWLWYPESTKKRYDTQKIINLNNMKPILESYYSDNWNYPENLDILIPNYAKEIPKMENTDKNITDKCYTEIQYKKIDKDNYEVSICLEAPKEWENKVYTLRN